MNERRIVIEFKSETYLNPFHFARMYVARRITVHFFMVLAVVAYCGCSQDDHSVVPVPIVKEPPFTYEGTIKRMWGGDNFEVYQGDKVHFAYLRGIDTPKNGQYGYQEAIDWVRAITDGNVATIEVLERDELKREVCKLAVFDRKTNENRDVSIELLENGWAWFDHSEGQYADIYKAAEAKARDAKVGIWSQPDPTPPWVFWEQEMDQLNKSMQED
ncbi:MAG: thermonuclease family protein [Planctomycetota bacterium]